MRMRRSLILFIAVAAVICGCCSKPTLSERATTPRLTKEILLHADGQDRHWVMKAGGLIREEHYLTAHGDLHVVVEYPKGVHSPQVDTKGKREDAEALTRAYWRDGKRMSVTPMVGDTVNGLDFAWWPNGNMAREAVFVMNEPSGTWKFYDLSGRLMGKGVCKDGRRWSGVFVGDPNPGADFFWTSYPMKKETYKDGSLIREEEFLKELKSE